MQKISITFLVVIILQVILLTPSLAAQNTFWDKQQKGTNFFNEVEKQERFKSAKQLGLTFVRLSPNKWLSTIKGAKRGDFLIGSFNNPYVVPPQEDIAALKKILDEAEKEHIEVLLTMISLPYSRWSQHNNAKEDRRIWEDFTYQEQVIKFWTNLAKALNNHPALVGYNIRNEPSPERAKIKLNDWYTESYEDWYKKVKGTPQDLNLFNKKIVAAIRKVNKTIPIVIESGYYATPYAFKILEPIANDNNILYSFHMYEPFAYTNDKKDPNGNSYKYPGYVPIGELSFDNTKKSSSNNNVVKWDRDELEKFLQPITDFQKKYNIPNNRIIVSEFGVKRQNMGAKQYLEDLIYIFNKHGWHWAFYSYREDNWDAMDYELGTKKPPYSYWQSIEKGEIPDYSKIKDKSLINVIKNGLNN